MKKFFVTLLVLIVIAAATAAALFRDARIQLQTPLPISAAQQVELPAGRSLRSAIEGLESAGMLANHRQGRYLEWWARWHQQATAIHAGEYRIEPDMSPLDVLNLWLSGKTVLHDLRIIEGMHVSQMLQRVAENDALVHTLDPLTPDAVMSAIGKAGQDPEGRFFPDTYRFPRGTTDVDVLRQAYEAMDKVLTQAWSQRQPNLPIANADEALILASIIEKETGLESERPQIAGVFTRRLELGMRLQTDPTVIYGMGEAFDGNIRKRDLTTDTPYNTYTRDGLPPGPICLPGRAAIEAAVQPLDGTSLYFVGRGDGSHAFSATLAEHEAAVRRFQLGRGG